MDFLIKDQNHQTTAVVFNQYSTPERSPPLTGFENFSNPVRGGDQQIGKFL